MGSETLESMSEFDLSNEINRKLVEAIHNTYINYQNQKISRATARYTLNALSTAMVGLSDDTEAVELMSEMSAELRERSGWEDASAIQIMHNPISKDCIVIQYFGFEYKIVLNQIGEGKRTERVFEYDTPKDCLNAIATIKEKLVMNHWSEVRW
jgi:hypothetical protein